MPTLAKIDSTPVSLPAAADLSTKLFRFGKFTATGVNVCTVAGEKADGVIGAHYKKTPAAGDFVDFYVERLPIVEAGGAIAINDQIATDANGKAKVAGAGDNVLGIALDASTADTQFIRFRTPYTRSPSAANVSDAQTAPGAPVVYTFAVADVATADYDRVVTEKIEVLDVIVQKQGGANVAGTATVKNAANAISNAIAADTDKAITRAGTIDDAFSTIAAGGTLRLSFVKAGVNGAALVTVLAIKRA